ncbi:MAG: mannose-6-phosphate isomerase, partial [Actinomycetota bacterium]|nr:mannose-6-phosphate isomerase [Actinomycetota bacterium]
MAADALDLDAPEDFAAVDPADALGDVEATAAQWAAAAQLATVRLDLADADAVVVTGMGGSGICGDVVWALGQDRYPLPIVVHKGYGLPGFVGRRTVVVAVSYSGGTEETRSAFAEAARRGARRFA